MVYLFSLLFSEYKVYLHYFVIIIENISSFYTSLNMNQKSILFDITLSTFRIQTTKLAAFHQSFTHFICRAKEKKNLKTIQNSFVFFMEENITSRKKATKQLFTIGKGESKIERLERTLADVIQFLRRLERDF